MHTMVETSVYLREAGKAGLMEAEMIALVNFIAANPAAGDVIRGSGGCRKVRFAGKGKGKSGGYRVITYYVGEGIPVFLLTVYSKGRLGNLTDAQTNVLKVLTKELERQYRK